MGKLTKKATEGGRAESGDCTNDDGWPTTQMEVSKTVKTEPRLRYMSAYNAAEYGCHRPHKGMSVNSAADPGTTYRL